MKKFITTLVLCFGIFVANAQVFLDYATIEDIVKNEREYFDEIVDIYKNDDPMIRLDDIALVIQYFATHPRILASIRAGMLK